MKLIKGILVKILFFSVVCLMGQRTPSAQGQPVTKRPNILFIMADDLTRWDVGCYGSRDSKTPTIDSLASTGMKFNNCYQASPMCSPTRHNLLTGMYPVRTGAYPNHTYAKLGTKSVVHYLKPLGYRVAFSGKRHILPKEVFPFEYLDGDGRKERDPEFDKVEGFFQKIEKGNESFCLFMNFTSPHSPWNKGDVDLFNIDSITLPPYLADLPETRKKFRSYLAEINYLDGQVNQTMNLLKKYSFDKDTFIIFCTEQGNSFPFAKWTLYNAGVGSGLIVNWPDKIKKGVESDALVEFSDILPTMIDVAGGSPVGGLDGTSLLPVLFQEKNEHKDYTYSLQTTRTIYSGAEYYPIRAISDGEYRLILNLTPEIKFKNTVTELDSYFSEWRKSANPIHRKLAWDYQYRPPVELYNDIEDPYNLNNLANNKVHANLILCMKDKLNDWMDYCGDFGLSTEFTAKEHTRKKMHTDRVDIQLEFSASQKEGNIVANSDGYYFFYSNFPGAIKIDGKRFVFGQQGEKNYSKYAVVALKEGKHYIEGVELETLEWSGPNFYRRKLKL